MKKLLILITLIIGFTVDAQIATSGLTNSGSNASTIGYQTSATNTVSKAIGREILAGGETSTAIGYKTSATNTATTALGNNSTASGIISIAIGNVRKYFTN